MGKKSPSTSHRVLSALTKCSEKNSKTTCFGEKGETAIKPKTLLKTDNFKNNNNKCGYYNRFQNMQPNGRYAPQLMFGILPTACKEFALRSDPHMKGDVKEYNIIPIHLISSRF